MNNNYRNKKTLKNKNGFIAFITLLIISSVALVVAISISLLGTSHVKSSLDFKKGIEVEYSIAESCLEEALLRIRNDENYPGGSLDIGNGACTIAVSGSGTNRTIDIAATLTQPFVYTKRITAQVKRSGNSVNIISVRSVD